MEFNKQNIDLLIEEKFKKNISDRKELSQTWKININKTREWQLQFHNAFGGLTEPNFKYYFKFKKKFFLNYLQHPLRFLWSVVKSIYNKHLNRIIEKTDFRFINQLQVKTPQFKNSYNGFYKNINGKCYNNNIRKYSQHYLFLLNNINLNSINTYCEIGAGYGGMIELLILKPTYKNS